MSSSLPSTAEIERIRRVSDQICTAHSGLRDRYARRALVLDLLILAASTWLVALSFVDSTLSARLTPGDVNPQMWIGILGVITFFLSILQLKTDWKSRADSHKRSADTYAAVKREAGYVLASGVTDPEIHKRVIDRYDMASVVSVAIPESEFLKQKRRHLVKVALSKQLDSRPSASILWLRIQFWFRDNFSKS